MTKQPDNNTLLAILKSVNGEWAKFIKALEDLGHEFTPPTKEPVPAASGKKEHYIGK